MCGDGLTRVRAASTRWWHAPTARPSSTFPSRTGPIYLGSLPKTPGSRGNSWRDVKVYRNHAYVVADGALDHGMQVFDLTRLRDVANPPATFEPDALYEEIASAHNIVINEQTGFAYAVGANSGGETCGGGLHMIDIREPGQLQFAGCFTDSRTGRVGTGYSHDALCIVYDGPDREHAGKEICFGSNETALSIGRRDRQGQSHGDLSRRLPQRGLRAPGLDHARLQVFLHER